MCLAAKWLMDAENDYKISKFQWSEVPRASKCKMLWIENVELSCEWIHCYGDGPRNWTANGFYWFSIALFDFHLDLLTSYCELFANSRKLFKFLVEPNQSNQKVEVEEDEASASNWIKWFLWCGRFGSWIGVVAASCRKVTEQSDILTSA